MTSNVTENNSHVDNRLKNEFQWILADSGSTVDVTDSQKTEGKTRLPLCYKTNLYIPWMTLRNACRNIWNLTVSLSRIISDD